MKRLLAAHRKQLVFFVKMLVAYGVWFVLYDLWLRPAGDVDAWLSYNVADTSGSLLTLLGLDAFSQGRVVGITDLPGVRIADGCNGLSTIGLFVGFIMAFPGQAWRRTLFLPLGIILIYLANIGRVALLALFQHRWTWAFDAFHALAGTTLFYLLVLMLWVAWAHYGTPTLTRVKPSSR